MECTYASLPPELWAHILALGCTDGGHTGRSLSLVSRFFHAASAPVRHRTLIVTGADQLLAFAALLDSSPAACAGCQWDVRNLFLSTHCKDPCDAATAQLRASMPEMSAPPPRTGRSAFRRRYGALGRMLRRGLGSRRQPEAPLGALLLAAIATVLARLAPTLRSLALFVFRDAPHALIPVTLPALSSLICLGWPACNTAAQPRLTRLHLVGVHVPTCWAHLGAVCPALTHLRLSVAHDSPLGAETWVRRVVAAPPPVQVPAGGDMCVCALPHASVEDRALPLPLSLREITVYAPRGDDHGGGCVVVTEHVEERIDRATATAARAGVASTAWGASEVVGEHACVEEYGQRAALRDWLARASEAG